MFLGRRETLKRIRQKIKENKRLAWLLRISPVIVVALIIGVPFYQTAQSSFYANNPNLKSQYKKLQKSAHKGITCVKCHVEPGLASETFYKIDAILSYYTKPQEKKAFDKVPMNACLECHNKGAILNTNPSSLIPHRTHTSATREKKDCRKCHKWTGHQEDYQNQHKSSPFTLVCEKYGCHGNIEEQGNCNACHHKQTIPEDKWRKEHRTVATEKGATRCFEYCHTTSYCQECHKTGQKPATGPEIGNKLVQAQVQGLIPEHTRKGWSNTHGTYARSEREVCLNCHAGFESCDRCHKKRPKSHGSKELWIGTHKNRAKDNEQSCLTCHKKKQCDRCHKLFRDVGR